MAVTKIKPIKSTLKKALGYICNPKKTNEKILISSFGCHHETADIEFGFTLSQAINTAYPSGKRTGAQLCCVLFHTIKDKLDMTAIELHKLFFHKFGGIIVTGDADCFSRCADGFKDKGKRFRPNAQRQNAYPASVCRTRYCPL